MLTAARRERRRHILLVALAVAQALRLKPRGTVAIAQSVQTYQAAAVSLSLQSLAAILAEQAIDQAAETTVAPGSLLTSIPAVTGMLEQAETAAATTRLVQTLVQDAARTARAVDLTTRPAVTGWIRSVQVPCCSRCAVLAGRVYRWSDGFKRHPGCDCLMTPVADAGPDLATDPAELFRQGQIRGLSAGETAAVHAGADLGQVVNVRRRQAGLTVGSSVMVRSGRLTPQGCISLASDRSEALDLLRRYRYIT